MSLPKMNGHILKSFKFFVALIAVRHEEFVRDVGVLHKDVVLERDSGF
jgi:hypothetical protein